MAEHQREPSPAQQATAGATGKASERHQTAFDEAGTGSTARDATGTQQAGFATDARTAVNPDEDLAAIDSPATVDADEESVPDGK